MAFNIGINVLETDGKATPSIQGAATSVAGFIIRAERGLAGVVTRVSSPSQFREHFGMPFSGGYGPLALQGFFDNGGVVAYVLRLVDGTVAVAASKAFKSGTAASLTVTAGYMGTQDLGTWGNNIAILIRANADNNATYDLLVRYKNDVVETYTALDNRTTGGTGQHPAPIINDPNSGSKFIMVAEDGAVNPSATLGQTGADPKGWMPLSGGLEDGLNAAAVAIAATTALDFYDTVDVQLIACPETADTAFVQKAVQKCETRGDCMFVGTTAINQNLAAAKAYGKSLQGTKIYGAIYWPWIEVMAPSGARGWIPPTGHILGVFARTEGERGIWKAPAGNAARLGGALDVETAITDVDHTDLVKNGSVNAVRFVPGQGIIVDSSRTLSTNPLWLYVNIRLLFNYVKSSLKAGLRWVVQEPNSEELWNKVKFNSVTPFLMGLWRKGAFGPGKPEQVFSVKCDADTNPPASIQQGIFTVEVYFYPSRPAETVVIVVGQQEGAGSATEA
jgi:phage tail sheath protein FI